MKLYGYFRSSTTYRLRIALELKAIEYEYIPVNLLESEQNDAGFTTRNPFGTVPMLVADGRDRAQSMAQLAWLDEAYPENPLLPADIEDRYTVRELAYAIATETHAPNNLSVLKYLKANFDASQEQLDDWYRHWLARTLGPVEARLAQHNSQDFLLEKPGLFEVLLLPQMYNARRFTLDLSGYPHMTRIEQACMAMPEFHRAHPDNQPDTPEGEKTL